MTEIEKFYQELDSVYSTNDLKQIESFLLSSRKRFYERGQAPVFSQGCPSCVPEPEPNLDYVSVCNELACFYRGLSRWQDSMDSFSSAVDELRRFHLSSTPNYAMVLLNMAGTCRLMGEKDKALDNFTQAEEIFKKSGVDDPYVYASLYNNIALVHQDLGDADAALRCLLLALENIEKTPGNVTELGSTCNNLAALYISKDETEKAGEYIDRAIQALKKAGDEAHYPAALNTRGTLNFRRGEYAAALEDFSAALELTEKVYGRSAEYASGCENCAGVCEKLGDIRRAEDYRQRARSAREQVEKQNAVR